MGVDAKMLVRHKGKLTDDEVRLLAADLSAAFWREPFMIARPGDKYTPEGRHALEITERYEQDGPDIEREEGDQFIRVNLFGRFYGKGYERGNWPQLYAIARWLKTRIAGCSVWYGGDSSGCCAEEMTDAFCDDMWAHFIAEGHAPYAERKRSMPGDPPQPFCSFCKRAMSAYSWGPYKRVGFACASCEYKCETVDGGVTFKEFAEKS